MNKLSFTIFMFVFIFISTSSKKNEEQRVKPWTYNINIEYKDTTLFISLYLKANKSNSWKKDFLLFNRYITIDEILLNNKPLNYTRSNDTLYLETSNKNEINLYMRYKIPCSLYKSSKIIKEFSDSVFIYPAQLDSNQVFCERYNKFYPVIYDNFSNYNIKITVPKTFKIFVDHKPIENKFLENKTIGIYNFFDEDFRFFITKSNIFRIKKVIQNKTTYCKFYFLPKNKRLLSFINNKAKYTTDYKQIDSLYNTIINRSSEAINWFQTNLWYNPIDTLRFIETGILGLSVNMRSFIIFDKSLMNMEVINNYAFSHEIGHLWIGYKIKYSSKGYYFLSESMNEYVNLLFYKSWAGEKAFENAIKDKINMKFSNKPFFTVTFEQVLNQKSGELNFELIYNKGVVFAHEFCNLIGENKFLKIVRDTYNKNDGYISLKDFENSIKNNGCWDSYLQLYKINL